MELKMINGRYCERRLAEAWDRDVPLRHLELATQFDSAYYLLVEHIASTILASGDAKKTQILDVGCGLGVLTSYLAEQGHTVTGIDISRASIVQAQSDYGRNANFRVGNVAHLPHDLLRRFDVVVANMVWHNYPHLNAIVAGCGAALKRGGSIVAAVAEPKSYLLKQGVSHRYDVPRRFNFPLRHAYCCGSHTPVPYYHRPVETYLEKLRQNHFVDISVDSSVGNYLGNDVVTFVGSVAAEYEASHELSKQSHSRGRKATRRSRVVSRGCTHGALA
jgi:SAM-dependent methyltransferase